MFDLRTLLTPPANCQQRGSAMKDKRRGWLWHCSLSGKNMGASHTMPPCLCKHALGKASAALARTEDGGRKDG